MTISLNIETAPLDESTKVLLRKLLANGCAAAGVSYVVEPSIVSKAEFEPLIRATYKATGGANVGLDGSVLASFSAPNIGPNAGKIVFELRVNLE